MRIRFLLLLLSASSTVAFSQGTWTSKANFGGGVRNRGIAFSIGHKGYCGLGIGGGIQQDLWEYDPITNAWTQKAPFPGGGRTDAIAFVVSGKAYVGTGRDGASVDKKDIWRYDPTNNTWTQRASLGGVIRRGAVAFSIGNFGYLGTGQSGTTLLNDFWRYDPNQDQWTQRTSYPGSARFIASGFALNGLGYLGTGQAAGNALKKDMYAFNPANNTWIARADFGGTSRNSTVGFTVGNFGYVGTGLASNGRQPDVWRYDAGINSWSAVANAPTALISGTVFSIGGLAYLATGFTTTTIASVVEFTPQSALVPANTWTRKANFLGGNSARSIAFSIGSKGYVGSGGGNVPYKKDLWEFDPASNAWSQKADMGLEGRFGAVGFGVGAKGYVTAGRIFNPQIGTSFFTSLTRAYDPLTNTWATKASIQGPGRTDGVAFGIGAKGYVGTGSGLNDFWEYDPATNAWSQKATFGGVGRTGAVGFSISGKGYIGTGADENSDELGDFWAYDPLLNSWTQKADFGGTARKFASGFAIGNKGYIGTGDAPSSVGDFWEYDPETDVWTPRADFGGGPSSGGHGLSVGSKGYVYFWRIGLGIRTRPVELLGERSYPDPEHGQVQRRDLVEIAPSGSPNAVCNGSGYASNSTINIACCLPDGCYDLRVFDSFGDGILSPGGYVLNDAANSRIVDNNGNGSTFTTLSQVTNGNNTPWSFCVPLGTDALVPASCDQVFTLNTTVILQVQENPAVTAALLTNPDTSGYQICIFDPNGGFRRNVFQSFGQPGTAFPVGTANALKPTFFNLNFSQAPFLPVNKLLNVRVRGKVNGTFLNCGPACRLVVGTPPCTTTKLTTTLSPQISCGSTKSVNGGQLFCDLVSGANRYRFQFAGPNNYLRNVLAPAAAVNSLASRTLTLGVFQQQPLPCGVPLTVRVQASFDGGVTFCPFGQDCFVTVTGCPVQLRVMEEDAPPTGLLIWPNPSAGGRVNIRLDGVTADIATLELTDAYGKLVRREKIKGAAHGINTVLDPGGDIAEGLYFLTVVAGEETFTKRVMITR